MKDRNTSDKSNLHPRNPHRSRYDFEQLTAHCPELKKYVITNQHNIETIDFSNPAAVKTLNRALLMTNYDLQFWNIPLQYLCPPIPGRADYIHYIADLLAESNDGKIPQGKTVQGLDVGVGANCIYPIIGNHAYGWSFVGSDIDKKAIENCTKIIQNNPKLIDVISLQLQTEKHAIFKNIISRNDRFAFTICNPPFHASLYEATKGSLRKINNLSKTKQDNAILNFGGQSNELWCPGGEISFITQMINESTKYAKQCLWFTTLVSKEDNLNKIHKILGKVGAVNVKTIDMSQGQKKSRMVAWTFLTEAQQKAWKF